MRGNERHAARKTHDDGRMIKLSRIVAKLYEISDFQLTRKYFLSVRPCARTDFFRVAYQKTIEKFHTRPRRRAIIQAFIIPTERWLVVHNACACKQALRGVIRAIAAQAIEIVIRRISRKRPFTSVGDDGVSIIFSHTIIYAIKRTGVPIE